LARRRRLAALVAVGLLVAACSGGGGKDGTSSRSSSSTSSRSADGDGSSGGAGPGATGVTLGGTEGGTVKVGLAGPIQVDPVLASPADPAQEMVLDLLHDGLTHVVGNGVVQPAVASQWSAYAAFKVWRFTIDPAATFTSGRSITATDVVGSIEHVIAAGESSLAALRLEPIQGFRAYLDRASPSVSGLVAVDPSTVQISLDRPLAVLPGILAAPAYGVVDLTSLAAAANGDRRGLDLSGAWKVASAATDRLVLARRSANLHLDTVDLRSYKDATAAYRAFRKGSVDWAPVPTDQLGAARAKDGTAHLTPYQSELAIGLRVPNLPSLPFRQAIAAALDRRAIVAAVYPDLADALPTVIPAGVVGHDAARCPTCGHDPARAKALLAQAFPSGPVPRVTFSYDSSPAQQALAAIVVQDLRAVGIPVTAQPLSLDDYQHLLVSGGQQLFTLSWIGADRSPDAYLDPLFRSDSPDNLVALSAPAVDGPLAQARATQDPAVASAAWASAERQVLEAAVVVPIAQFRSQVVVAKRVLGLVTAVDGTVDWAQVRVEGGA
jgi:ABC-type transport system substrate-binding protein